MSANRTKHLIGAIWNASRFWLLGLVGVTLLGGFYYFLATVGPKPITDVTVVSTAAENSDLTQMSDEISSLESQYRQAADAKLITDESKEALVKAVEKQKELLRKFANANLDQSARLTRLETELGSLLAKEKVLLVDRLQADGEELLDAGKVEEAGIKLKEALQIQKEINLSSASSRYKNYVRETALVQAVGTVQAAPLRAEMVASLTAARQAVKDERWADALSSYTAARDSQVRINREYSRTRYADLAEADRLSAEIESLNAAGIVAGINDKEKAGNDALAQGLTSEAATYFADAAALQLKVNQNYPRSRFVSSQRIDDLEVKRQTALSSGLADALAQLDRAIGEHLRKRQVVAADQKLEQASTIVNRLFTDYPKSTLLNGSLRIKLAYLTLRRADLRQLQDQVYDLMLPLPGAGERQILRIEVPQSLYVLVMNTNPSRNPGRNLPVDSVNWTDAQEFCTRLSWMLGTSVRLPTLDEFRVALGDQAQDFWSSQNSEGRSREVGQLPPNVAGFNDLLGNVAEWVAADPDTDKSQVFGGSYLDTPEVLKNIPVETRLKSDRARHVGVRIVMGE